MHSDGCCSLHKEYSYNNTRIHTYLGLFRRVRVRLRREEREKGRRRGREREKGRGEEEDWSNYVPTQGRRVM